MFCPMRRFGPFWSPGVRSFRGIRLKNIWAALIALAFTGPVQAGEITVFAASSLKSALDLVALDWQAETGNIATVSYDGSAKLAKQIEQGAPADMFISAAESWMDVLEDAGLIRAGTRRDILGNRLVLVAGAEGTQAPASANADAVEIGPEFDLAQRLGDGKLAMGMIASVPAGQYGHEALVALGLWDSVASAVVETDNVRAAVKLVALGEAAMGIVYASDAVGEAGIAVVGMFPEASHAPIIYPAALTGGAKPDAAAFMDYLSSPQARARFSAQGFVVPQ